MQRNVGGCRVAFFVKPDLTNTPDVLFVAGCWIRAGNHFQIDYSLWIAGACGSPLKIE
jgi:hypothetical protein